MTENHISAALNLTKVIGTVLTGAFGLLGLLTEFRDSVTKKITRWGRYALIGILASTSTALISQVLEFSKATRDAQAATRLAQAQITKSNAILNEVERTLKPLQDVRISYWLQVPVNDPALLAYRKRLEVGAAQIVANHSSKHDDYRLGYPDILDESGKVESVAIPLTSPLFPTARETIPFYLMRYTGLHLQFFKNYHDDASFLANDVFKLPRANLEMDFYSSDLSPSSKGYELEYKLEEHSLQIVAMNLRTNSEFWRSDGEIVSFVDLANVQLAAKLDDTMFPKIDALSQATSNLPISRLRAKMSLGIVILSVQSRELWLDEQSLPRHQGAGLMHRLERNSASSRPSTLYVTTLPADLTKLSHAQ
jgi:hypothetical protein